MPSLHRIAAATLAGALLGIGVPPSPSRAATVREGAHLRGVSDPTAVQLLDYMKTGRLSILAVGRLDLNIHFQDPQPDGTYSYHRIVIGGTSPHSITGADLNGDGIMDMLIADNETGDFAVYMGKGNGEFENPRFIHAFGGYDPHGPISLVACDMDGDNIPDVALALNMDSEIAFFKGHGDGTFDQPYAIPTGQAPHAVIAGDFFGNGRLDLAVACLRTSSVFLHENLGNGVFGPPVVVHVGFEPRMLTAADFNRDGLLDLAVSNVGDETVAVVENLGHGKFKSETVAYEPGTVYGIASGDINGDGYPDIVAADVSLNKLIPLINMGTGGFDFYEPNDFPALTTPQTLAIGDVNNDGVDDIAVGSLTEQTVDILYGTAASSHPPLIRQIDPPSAPPNQMVTIRGRYFGEEQHQSRIRFNGVDAGWADYWSDIMIRVRVPPGATDGPVQVVTSQANTLYPPRPFKVQMRGDVDGDGQITVHDAAAVLRAIVDQTTLTPDQMRVADVSPLPAIPMAAFGDGQLQVDDASVILKVALGLLPTSALNP